MVLVLSTVRRELTACDVSEKNDANRVSKIIASVRKKRNLWRDTLDVEGALEPAGRRELNRT